MNRKTFLQTSAAATLSLVAFPTFYSCKQSKEKARAIFDSMTVSKGSLTTVRGNVSRFNNQGGTVGLLETSDGFVVIDAQFPESIQPLIDTLSTKEGKPVEFLCNTHHHGDHTAGNIAFKGVAKSVLAQNQVPQYQLLRAEESNSTDKQLYATTLFDKEYKIELGGDVVMAYHFGAGHTVGDAIYHFEQDNVVHMGDLMFNKVLPVFRVKDGSNAYQWVSILETVINKFDDDTQFIYGHSYENDLTTGTKADLEDMKSFLRASIDFVEKEMISNGKTAEEMVTDFKFIPGFESRKALWDTHWDDFMGNLVQSISSK